MLFEHPPLIALPTELSDEAAAKLLEWLYELAAKLLRRSAPSPLPPQRCATATPVAR